MFPKMTSVMRSIADVRCPGKPSSAAVMSVIFPGTCCTTCVALFTAPTTPFSAPHTLLFAPTKLHAASLTFAGVTVVLLSSSTKLFTEQYEYPSIVGVLNWMLIAGLGNAVDTTFPPTPIHFLRPAIFGVHPSTRGSRTSIELP